MPLCSARAGLLQIVLLHNAVILFPKTTTATYIELANQTSGVIKGILDGRCFIDNQTGFPDVVNVSCTWETPVENAPLCTVWINWSNLCSGNCSQNISCTDPSCENNTYDQHPLGPGDSGILIGAIVGGSAMGVVILCVLITRRVYIARNRRTKGRIFFSGRRTSVVTLSGSSEISSRRQEVRESRQGKAKVNSLRDQTVKISSDSETEDTSAPYPQGGIVLPNGGNKRAIASTAYEEIADTVIEARITETHARNDKTGKKDLKVTVEGVPTAGVGVDNDNIVKRKHISSNAYEDVPDSLAEHAPVTTKPLPKRVKKDHWKRSVEVVFLTPPEAEPVGQSDVS